MSEIKAVKCLQCGGEIEVNSLTGVGICPYCDSEYRESADSFFYELQEIVNRRQMREFIQAEDLCKELIYKHPECSEAYWQMLLSTLGVVYVQEDIKSKPTFFSYSYDERESITDNEYYKNAIKYSTSAQDKSFYQEKVKELDSLLKEFFNLVAKESSYDIFISFKKTTVAIVDGEERIIDTDDYMKAKEIYKALKDDYKVFFSPVSIGEDTGIEGEKYEPRILKALQTAQAMILVGSKKEYIESQWVENEWRRYQYFIQRGNKKKQSLVLVYLRNMPSLPIALRDVQLPSIDMFKGSYLKELRDKLSFVRSSKGIKSVIDERKIQHDFKSEEDKFNFGQSVTRIEITENSEVENIQISGTEEREMKTASTVRNNGRFDDAVIMYDQIIKKNQNCAKAYFGRFLAKIKAKTKKDLKECILSAKHSDLEDFEMAVKTSYDVDYAWFIVDLMIDAINGNGDWLKLKCAFDSVIKFLDNERLMKLLSTMQGRYTDYVKCGKVKLAEDVFASCRKLFAEENMDFNLSYMKAYGTMLFEHKHYDIARKYFEELALVDKNAEYYLYILKCRIKSQSLSNAPFNLSPNRSEGDNGKEISQLSLDEIIGRIILCEFEKNLSEVRKELIQMIFCQIKRNKKNAKNHIDTVVGCYKQLGADDVVKSFLIEISDKYVQAKDFKSAEAYFNEILTQDANCSYAYWGLLKCRLKAINDTRLAKKRKSFKKYKEYNDALNCATNEEYKHYMAVSNGEKFDA